MKLSATWKALSLNDKCDVGGIILDDDTKEIRAISYNYGRTERQFYDKELEGDYKLLKSQGPEGCEVQVETVWIFSIFLVKTSKKNADYEKSSAVNLQRHKSWLKL